MLDTLGFGPVEVAAYDVLVLNGRMSLADVSAKTDATPEVARQALEVLEGKGLVRRLAGPDQQFVVAPPEHAIEVLIAEQMSALQGVRARSAEVAAQVRRVTQDVDPTSLIEIVSGEGSVRQLFHQVVRSARQELAVFDCPPYALVAEGVEEVTNDQQQRMRSDGLRLRTVFERSLLDDPAQVHRILRGVAAGEQSRIASVPLKLAIIDRDWGILPLLHAGEATPEAAVIVRRSVLLDSMLALFELVWEHAVEVKPQVGEPTASKNRMKLPSMSGCDANNPVSSTATLSPPPSMPVNAGSARNAVRPVTSNAALNSVRSSRVSQRRARGMLVRKVRRLQRIAPPAQI